MRHSKLNGRGDLRYDENGGAAIGDFYVGEDHVVRWFTRDEVRAMEGVGPYSGWAGYNVYDDQGRPVAPAVVTR